MKRGMFISAMNLVALPCVFALGINLAASADSEASRQNSSSAATENHSEASVEAGRTTVTNHGARTISTASTTKKTAAVQPGIKTVGHKKFSHRHHSGNSSRSYMINTIQQAARTK